MAIARDTAAQGNVALSATLLEWDHTISGSDRGLFVGVKAYAVNDVSATYNSVSMGSPVVSILMDEGNYAVCWYLSNPDTGTHKVSISRSGAANHLAGASWSGTGISQSGQPENFGSSKNTSDLAMIVGTDQSWLVMFNAQAFPGYAQSDIGSSRAVISGPPDFQYLDGIMELGPASVGTPTIQTNYAAGGNGNVGIVIAPSGGAAPRFILGTH